MKQIFLRKSFHGLALPIKYFNIKFFPHYGNVPLGLIWQSKL